MNAYDLYFVVFRRNNPVVSEAFRNNFIDYYIARSIYPSKHHRILNNIIVVNFKCR